MFALLLLLVQISCKQTEETTADAGSAVKTKEEIYRKGHQLYIAQEFDSARATLKEAAAMDPAYLDPRLDLGALFYDMALRDKPGSRTEYQRALHKALTYYAQSESLGSTDSDVYERLSEIGMELHDNDLFLKYAKKNVDHYPYERQYFNLSLAYFNGEEYGNAIKILKEAIDKFPLSTFIGSYYRQLGLAYMKMRRDQTAERVFYTGLGAVNDRIAAMEKDNRDYETIEEYRRMKDDRIGMLVSLRRLHQLYGQKEKLKEIERLLKEAGYKD